MAYRDPRPGSLAFCERHALSYDASVASGCVVCRRDEPAKLGAPFRKRTLLWAVPFVSALLAGLGVLAWRGREIAPLKDEIRVLDVPVPHHVTAQSMPVIRGVVASDARVGARVGLECQASQVDGEPNGYKWVGPFGMTKGSASNVAVWTPARAGPAAVTCWARNSVGTTRAEITINVAPAALPVSF